MTLIIMDPFVASQAETGARDARPIPSRPSVVLMSNGKPFAREMLEAIGSALQDRDAIAGYEILEKTAMVVVDDTTRDDILARADVVVSGVGDCGGCTACSTTDALIFRREGALSFVVATESFRYIVDGTENEFGVEGLQKLYVEHPIWTRDAAWFSQTGSMLADRMVELWASEPPC
jgi:hypothetical protein